jgi:hypothetical protein
MTAINSYATLAEFKAYITASGQSVKADTADDTVIDNILEAASRHLDGETNRTFYPRYETRYFCVPDPQSAELMLDDDLLEITTLTNGDDSAISSTDYNLLPKNWYPKYGIRLTSPSGIYWEWDDEGNDEYVIDVAGLWGYHNRYTIQPGWVLGTTLAEALDISELPWDVTASTAFSAGQIVKVDSELCIVASTGTGLVTVVARGANGSTAATHDNGSNLYYWSPQRDVWQATIEIANNAWHRRFGQNVSGATVTTPGGMIIGPQDMTETAKLVIQRYRRLL